MSENIKEWGAADAAGYIRIPTEQYNKYSHGVLGVVTGSAEYPGAAVLGVEAAHRTGIGMVRFLGSKEPATLVLASRPETVTVSGAVNAWLIGSGMVAEPYLNPELPDLSRACLGTAPVVVDAGGLAFLDKVSAPAIITPHEGELERLFPREGSTRAEWAQRAARELGVVVALKGHETVIAAPQDLDTDESQQGAEFLVQVTAPTTWLATAGTGDVLAGVIAALAATQSVNRTPHLHELAAIAATGVYLHGQAALLASEPGPFPALEVAEHVSNVVAFLVAQETPEVR